MSNVKRNGTDISGCFFNYRLIATESGTNSIISTIINAYDFLTIKLSYLYGFKTYTRR